MTEDKVTDSDLIYIAPQSHPNTLSFHKDDGSEVGRLYWEDELKFEGDADESAQIFITFLKEMWSLGK